MDEVTIPEPECRPLRSRGHLVVAEDAAYVINRILEDGGRLKFSRIGTVPRKLERTEDCIGIGRYDALK